MCSYENELNLDDNATAQEKFTAAAGVACRPDAELGSCAGVGPATAPQARNGEEKTMRYALLWLLGIPIPVLLLLWFSYVL